MGVLKMGLLCTTALQVAGCAGSTTTEEQGNVRVVADGRSVYVVNVSTEQAGRAYAVSTCRERGGTAVFSEMVQYRYRRKTSPAARFDCTN